MFHACICLKEANDHHKGLLSKVQIRGHDQLGFSIQPGLFGNPKKKIKKNLAMETVSLSQWTSEDNLFYLTNAGFNPQQSMKDRSNIYTQKRYGIY